MNKRLNNLISFTSLVVTIASFLICFILYRMTNATKSIEAFSNTGFAGYIFFILVFTAPFVGLLFAIKSENKILKPLLIIGNSATFLTLSLITASIAFYDFI